MLHKVNVNVIATPLISIITKFVILFLPDCPERGLCFSGKYMNVCVAVPLAHMTL